MSIHVKSVCIRALILPRSSSPALVRWQGSKEVEIAAITHVISAGTPGDRGASLRTVSALSVTTQLPFSSRLQPRSAITESRTHNTEWDRRKRKCQNRR
ncbi:unnamed protein product [Arctogadus glacialis]